MKALEEILWTKKNSLEIEKNQGNDQNRMTYNCMVICCGGGGGGGGFPCFIGLTGCR